MALAFEKSPRVWEVPLFNSLCFALLPVVGWYCFSHLMKFKNNGRSITTNSVQRRERKTPRDDEFTHFRWRAWLLEFQRQFYHPTGSCVSVLFGNLLKAASHLLCKNSQLIEMGWRLDVACKSVFSHKVKMFYWTEGQRLLMLQMQMFSEWSPPLLIHLLKWGFPLWLMVIHALKSQEQWRCTPMPLFYNTVPARLCSTWTGHDGRDTKLCLTSSLWMVL